MTKAPTLLIPFVLLACSADAFSSAQPDPSPMPADTSEASAPSPAAPSNEGPDAQSNEAAADSSPGQLADAAADAPHEAADCSSCTNTDNSNCDPNGGWTGNMCPCECFAGLTQQALDHCGLTGCICVPSKFPKNPGLSCIKSAP